LLEQTQQEARLKQEEAMRLEAELDEARRKMQADERELEASRYTHTSHLLDTTVDETRFQVSNRELVKRAYTFKA